MDDQHITYVKRVGLLEHALQENCKYRLVDVQPLTCAFFNDGPRFRQKCTLRACPLLEQGEDTHECATCDVPSCNCHTPGELCT